MDVKKVDFQSPTAAQDFAESLHKTGFAVLQNHPMEWSNYEKLYQEWAEFFQSKACYDYPFDDVVQDGYACPKRSETAKGSKLKDIKSFYHLYFPHGRYPKEVSDLAKQIFDKTFELGKTLLKWLDEAMPEEIKAKLSMPLQDMVSLPRTLLRVLYYPPFTGTEEPGAIRAEAHGDINLITLLPAATQPGLQVQNDQGEWVDVPFDPTSIVINIGDMLSEATNGFYRSTQHRVINPTGENKNEARMTVPMFVHAGADVFISDKYPTAESFLNERLRELGLL